MVMAMFNIKKDPYSLTCEQGLSVYLRGEDKDYPLTYDKHWDCYTGEVPAGRYRLIANDVWLNCIPHYYVNDNLGVILESGHSVSYSKAMCEADEFDKAVSKSIQKYFKKNVPPQFYRS